MIQEQNRIDVLPGPYSKGAEGEVIQPSPATMNLVRSQVRALLESSPAFRDLDSTQRQDMAHNLVKINAYAAALIHDEWLQSRKLGQTPILKREESLVGPMHAALTQNSPPSSMPYGTALPSASEAAPASTFGLSRQPLATSAANRPPADEFSPRAAREVGRITQQTLNAIAFPTFVADLIKGTFEAIVTSSIRQMEAFGNLLANVAKTVDQFMVENISDNQARDFLVQGWPAQFQLEMDDDAARVRARDGADDRALPDFQSEFNLNEPFDDLDDDTIEEVLVPAARRQLARQRHQLLSTMVLMGINRIVVTSGRIKASMGFRIDASDTGAVETAEDFDLKNEVSYKAGGGLGSLFGGPSLNVKNTITYVSSSKKSTNDELNVEADLTGEVDLKFKSDYFPVERFADPNVIGLIQGNTANPTANTPNTGGKNEEATGNQPANQAGNQTGNQATA